MNLNGLELIEFPPFFFLSIYLLYIIFISIFFYIFYLSISVWWCRRIHKISFSFFLIMDNFLISPTLFSAFLSFFRICFLVCARARVCVYVCACVRAYVRALKRCWQRYSIEFLGSFEQFLTKSEFRSFVLRP